MKQAINKLKAFYTQHPLSLIVMVAGAILLLELVFTGVSNHPDSYTYKKAGQLFLSGQIDTFRTPSYPLFVGIITHFTGERWADYVIAICQIGIFLASVKCFWYLCHRISADDKITLYMTMFYAWIPGISNFTLCVLTESLSICGVVFFLTLLVRLSDTFKISYAISFIVLVTFMIFLRPSLLYLFVVLTFIAIVWMCTKRYKQAILVFFTVIVASAALWNYCKAIEKKTGIFMVSSVSVLTDDNTFLQSGLSAEVHFKDSLYQSITESYYKPGIQPEEHRAFYRLPFQTQVEYLRAVKKELGSLWYIQIYSKFLDSSKAFAMNIYAEMPLLHTISKFIPLQLNVCYTLLYIYAILLLIALFKLKAVNWLSWTLCLSGLGHIAVMVTSFSEWSRLFFPALPYILLIVAQLLVAVKCKINYSNFLHVV